MRLSLLPMTLPLLLLLLSLISTVTTFKECEEAFPVLKDLPKAMKGIGNLGFDLLRQFRKDSNLMISPYTLWRTFSYAAVGAEGDTLEEILNILGLSTKRGIINISEKLKLKYGSNETVTLADATGIYLKDKFNIKRCNYELSDMAIHVNFSNQTKTCKTINTFVKTATRGHIRTIIQPGMVGKLTRMILVDALYFKGLWKNKFDYHKTSKKEFYCFNKKNMWALTMYRPAMTLMNGKVGSLKARVIQLPYAGDFVFMTIVFPEVEGKDAFKTTLRKLNHQSFMNASREIQPSTINLHLPKFEFESTYTNNMIRALRILGMKHAFNNTHADFSSFKAGLYIERVIHKTKIKVNEEGNEASASASITRKVSSRGRKSIEDIRLNRPFIYVIHTPDILLFTGVYLRPEKKKN